MCSFENCPTELTTSNDNDPHLVTFDSVKFVDDIAHSSLAFIAIQGQSLKIINSSIKFFKRTTRQTHCRAIFFNTPLGTVDISSTSIRNCSAFDGSGGAGLLSLNALSVSIGKNVVTKFLSGWHGHDSFVFYGRTERILIDSFCSERATAFYTPQTGYTASGVYVGLSSPFTFTQINSTYSKCKTDARGGGITFENVQPSSVISFELTYFIENGGRDAKDNPLPGGSITLAPLIDPTNVSLSFSLCRFQSRKKKNKGDDVYAAEGWEGVLVAQSFNCCSCTGSETSIYIEGLTESKNTNFMPNDTLEGCTVIPKNHPFFEDQWKIFHIVFWPVASVCFIPILVLLFIAFCLECVVESTCFTECCVPCSSRFFCFPCYIKKRKHYKTQFNDSKKESHECEADEEMGRELLEGNWIKTSTGLGYIRAAEYRYVSVIREAIALDERKNALSSNKAVHAEHDSKTELDNIQPHADDQTPTEVCRNEVDISFKSSSFQDTRDNLALLRFLQEGVYLQKRALDLLKILE
ncbi:hypothetical protein BLNAU_12897 [Blattamonas nauphoetae]|uniref:Right handed beta helix domain-containing protein n=1 Tax=Blattamonas nauphoetae TaxID=2049346 RepID=A0ABQ9XN24_9EUKA|nr:hypothetical protein BLNAU_12897 [Blattamonas nauphoetae]